MRTVIYARYSSALQDNRSIEDQLRICRERCAAEGWTVVGEYADREISGRVYARPELQAMLERVALGGVDQVVAEALDRITRDEVDSPLIRKKLAFAGARIFTLAQGEITSLHTALQGAMDAMELKKIADRTRRGQRGNVAAGKATGGRAYGYRVANRIREDGSVEKGLTAIDEGEAEIVRRIFREFVAGASPLAIARTLNLEGVPSPSGGLWRVSSINGDRIRKNGILQNEIYVGRLVYNKTRREYDPETRRRVIRSNPPETWMVKEVPELRIVDDAAWAAVSTHRERIEGVPFHTQKRAPRLLSGLGRCGACGGPWIVIQKDRWGCARKRDGQGCANGRTIMNGEFERRVMEGMQGQFLDPEALELYLAEYRAREAEMLRSHRASSGRLRRALEESERRIGRFVAAIGDGGEDIPELRDALRQARAERDAAKAGLATIEADSVVRLHPELPARYRAEFANLSAAFAARPEQRAEAMATLRSLIDTITVSPAEGRGTLIEISGRMESLVALATGRPCTLKSVPRVRHGLESTLLRARA